MTFQTFAAKLDMIFAEYSDCKESADLKKILVAVENYPNNNGGVALMYVHTRNKAYATDGIDVTVLNFQAAESYVYDGIPVVTVSDYKSDKKKYDILVCHAANIRHHYLFLKKHGDDFERFIFFFHGHEVLKINKTYSKPYPYVRSSKIKLWLQDCYDDFKLSVWRKYYPKQKGKSTFVFVSNWMLDEFLKWTKIPYESIKEHCESTYNCVGKAFEEATYDPEISKEYDFITVRSYMDGSKYCIDLVNKLAFANPELKFLIVGKGEFFNHYEKAPNITWLNQTMNHQEIIQHMQKSRCALMPTRTDAQGLMMCEMAAFGIPVITSDIPVCHEVFDDFENAFFIDNQNGNASLHKYLTDNCKSKKDCRFFLSNTAKKEIEIIKNNTRH